MMQSLENLTSLISDIVPFAQDICIFICFCLGFLVFRSEVLRSYISGGIPKRGGTSRKVLLVHSLRQLHDDFTNRRYEQVLDGWSHLERHTVEALSLVVTSLLALGRPDDVGVFVAKTVANLTHLKSGLHQVVAAIATPSCTVRHQHISLALRDTYDHARYFFDIVAVKELLVALARHNDELRVAGLFANLDQQKCIVSREFLGKVVQSFLACKNLDAALGYLQRLLSTPSPECPPKALILEVVKMSAEAAIRDDSSTSGARPRAWDAIDALSGVDLADEAAILFLEWSARQTPVDVAMAARVEEMLRKRGPLPIGAYDALVRVHASSAGDQKKAFACFDEFVQTADANGRSEASIVGMISSCVEARNGTLAEHIFEWAQCQGCCTLPIFSATLKVLAAAKQPARVCALYESAKDNKSLVLDAALRGQIIEFAVQAGRLELARSLFAGTSRPNVQNYISLMRACGQEGKVEKALQLLQELQRYGDVDTVTYNCALDVCASCKNHALAVKVLNQMKAANRVDVVSYNIMLKLCMMEGAPPQASEEVLRDMRQSGLQPNTATYNSLLGATLATGDFAKAWRTIGQMETHGQGVDAYTLSIMFKGYKHERRTMDAESIDRAVGLIKKHSVKIDEVLVNAALEACISLRDVNRLRSTMATFQSAGWVLSKEASMHTYAVLIKAHGLSQNISAAWRLWSEVTVERRQSPTEQLYGVMLDVLVSCDRLDDALELFEEMKTTHHRTLDSQGFAVAYAMIIRGFTQRKNCVQALRQYEEMKSSGPKPSLVVLNTLIDACSRVGDMDAATRLFKDMTEVDVMPDLITYSTLIKGYCLTNDLDQALTLFKLMEKKGIHPDAIVFNSLLDGCAKKQMPSLCEQVIRDMEKAGVVPSNHSASILIKLYGRCKNLDAAFRVINEMPRKYGFKANNPVYTCLMSSCIANGQLGKAMELRVRMQSEGIFCDEKTYSTLLRGTLRAGSADQSIMLLNAALEQKARGNYMARSLLDEELVKSVLVLIRQRNLWETHGQELFERLQSAGINVRCPGARRPRMNNRNDGNEQQRENKSGNAFNAGSHQMEGRLHQQRQVQPHGVNAQ